MYQEKHNKIGQFNELTSEFHTLSAEYSLNPETDPGIAEWPPEKETALIDAMQIEEERAKLDLEIKNINKNMRPHHEAQT